MAADPVDPQRLRAEAFAILDAHWREPGYTCPNAARYPWMWLWDSCFHSVVWAELGRPDRAVAELATVFDHQDPESGFVPHMTYYGDRDAGASFWGRPWTSSITQPPMYGHAVAELVRRGIDVPGELIDRARAGLAFLLTERHRSPGGLVELVHPWESGADDSPRWDHFVGSGWTIDRWRQRKGELLESVQRSASGAPVANPAFGVGSASFTALVAYNAHELAAVTGDAELERDAAALVAALDRRWDAELVTWVDDGPSAVTSGRARTLEALLGMLVTNRSDIIDALGPELADPAAYGGPFGPAGVHRGEAVYDPTSYWRGPSWPQLSYLMWLAARRAGQMDLADGVAASLCRGASRSGWAEYWDPDTGEGGGAVPQSWTTLAVVVDGLGPELTAD